MRLFGSVIWCLAAIASAQQPQQPKENSGGHKIVILKRGLKGFGM
jgi:hypothetical protein